MSEQSIFEDLINHYSNYYKQVKKKMPSSENISTVQKIQFMRVQYALENISEAEIIK